MTFSYPSHQPIPDGLDGGYYRSPDQPTNWDSSLIERLRRISQLTGPHDAFPTLIVERELQYGIRDVCRIQTFDGSKRWWGEAHHDPVLALLKAIECMTNNPDGINTDPGH